MTRKLPPDAGLALALTLAVAAVIGITLANRVAGIAATVLPILGTAAAWLRNR